MGLSSELISQFVKITNDSKPKPKETTVYGTVKNSGGRYFVQLDGSSLLTPVIATTTMKDGDRVTVMIKNHSAVVTGNLTSPSATNDALRDLSEDLGIVGDDLEGITTDFDLLVKTVGEINDDLTETGMDVVALQQLMSGITKNSSGKYLISNVATINGFPIATAKVLWTGALLMNANETVTLSEKISSQVSGIVLAFSKYENNAAANYNFVYHFIPKTHVQYYNDQGINFDCNHDSSFDTFTAKYLYVSDSAIRGNELNVKTGTAPSGVKFNNALMALRQVIGV